MLHARKPFLVLRMKDRDEGEMRSEEHTSELQSPDHLVCRLLLEKTERIRRHGPGLPPGSIRGGRPSSLRERVSQLPDHFRATCNRGPTAPPITRDRRPAGKDCGSPSLSRSPHCAHAHDCRRGQRPNFQRGSRLYLRSEAGALGTRSETKGQHLRHHPEPGRSSPILVHFRWSRERAGSLSTWREPSALSSPHALHQ